MPRVVTVRAPSRLHFGLLAPKPGGPWRYGGAGVMLDAPGLVLRAEPAESFSAAGWFSERVQRFATQWRTFYGREPPPVRLMTLESPPEHVGLGLGTQLGLATAAALHAACGEAIPSPEQLARSVGRGRRSAVGVHGFFLGGLIVERGKQEGEALSPLDCRLEVPAAWRFLLVRPLVPCGASGSAEAAALDLSGPNDQARTERMIAELRESLVPAVATGDFAAFAASLARYGAWAGEFFAKQQAGLFNGPLLSQLVDRLKGLGAVGVGQSSWGPTLFAAMPDEASARELASRLLGEWPAPALDLRIASASPAGAVVSCQPS